MKNPANDIYVGDKFYHNNYSTRKRQILPDYLIVTKVDKGFVEAKYENHHVYTKERVFSEINLWLDSNLNPIAPENPEWIFLKGVPNGN